MQQVRKIGKNYRSVTGSVIYKGVPLQYESTLERDFLIYHTFRNDVSEIIPQPIEIPFQKNGRTYPYTPDYFVRFKDDGVKPLLVEVKYENEWRENWREWSDKWKAAIRYCKTHGYHFAIYDESRIRHEALSNVTFLKGFQRLATNESLIEDILQALSREDRTTVDALLNSHFKKSEWAQTKRILWHLMFHHRIGFDVWDDIKSDNLEIWYVGK